MSAREEGYARRPGRELTWALVLAGLAWSSSALADPCKAIPDRGPLPSRLSSGSSFAGPVVYVGDGDSLCVGLGPDPGDWVEVRLADFYAPELSAPGGQLAKATLSRLTRGRQLACVAQHRSYDRIVAECRIRNVSLGDSMRAAGIEEGGRGFESAGYQRRSR